MAVVNSSNPDVAIVGNWIKLVSNESNKGWYIWYAIVTDHVERFHP